MWERNTPEPSTIWKLEKTCRRTRLRTLASAGGIHGGIIPAVEKRIKVVVLNVGGMAMERALPEADQINYLRE